MSSFYVSTPLYYVNDKPHLGSAYSTVVADVLYRYHKLFGEDSRFQTGVDEHGQKVQQAAEKRGLEPQVHCDELAEAFKDAWDLLNLRYDFFHRTTDQYHKKAVQDSLQSLFDKGEIYSDTYSGWYSVSEEIFYTEKELVDGKSPSGKEVVQVEEKNYFFKMSKYRDALIKHIEDNPKFIQPKSRKNEVLGFLKQELGDLCISRPKTRLKWGIELPFDKDYVTYVWFDALMNYATGVGFFQPDRAAEYKKWWVDTGCTHIIGKDILITHTVYWTTMLLALEAPLPKCIYAHGWILNKDSEKMSKSKGSVMDPCDMKNLFGVDQLKYFLIHDGPLNDDAPASVDLIAQRINQDLANNLGNMLSRSTNLINKYYEGKTPGLSTTSDDIEKIKAMVDGIGVKTKDCVENFKLTEALQLTVQLIDETNRYLENTAPWKLAKTDPAAAGPILHVALEVLRVCGILLSPVMPEKCEKLLEIIGCSGAKFSDLEKFPAIAAGTAVNKPEPLFPRVQL